MEVTTAEAAARLGVTRQRVGDMLRAGDLVGRQIGQRSWLVDLSSVLDRRRIDVADGRPWADPTVQQVIDMLSTGSNGGARVSALIVNSDAETLFRKIARTVTTRRYSTRVPDRVLPHLALTGESALGALGARLVGDASAIHGYLVDIHLEQLEDEAQLVPSATGNVVVHALRAEHFPWHEARSTPPALVAVDCARSEASRVRAIGIDALTDMRNRWLATNV